MKKDSKERIKELRRDISISFSMMTDSWCSDEQRKENEVKREATRNVLKTELLTLLLEYYDENETT